MTLANPDDMIGRLVDGRYQIRSLIARGGMATVYVATDLRLERRVAIKIMHGHLAADENFRARFIREARAAAKLQHPNVVNVYDQGEDGMLAYIVMEYVPGITLRDLLHDHHRLTAEQAIDVMDAVLSGLQAAHRLGIVHRDLKPENVLLADDGRIKLSDFGLARAASANTASGQVLLGTIAYLSPELVTKGTAGIRSDIYSLGIMMYEMLTGEQPYRGDQPVNIAYRHANEDVPPPSDVQPDVPSELDDLVAWATEREPDDRPADAGAMLAALRQAEADLAGRPASTRTAVQGVPVGNEQRDPIVAGGGHDEGMWEDTDTDPTMHLVAGYAQPVPSHIETSAPPTAVHFAPQQAQASNGAAMMSLHDEAPAAGPVEQAAPPSRRRRWVTASVIIVLVLALVGSGGWYLLAGPGSYDAVPNVVGMQLEEAQSEIEALGFAVGTVTEEPSLEVPQGQVIAMLDEAGESLGGGERLAPGTPINLTVSSGPRIIAVPSVVGLTESQAQFAIVEAGFSFDPATTIYEFSDTERLGTVIAATNAQGEPLPDSLAEQEPIRLIVSAGPIPDVVGSGEASAIATLQDAGLQPVVTNSVYHNSIPAGAVVSLSTTTDPVRVGDTVNLTLSKGPDLVAVPNVVGMSVADAVKALEAAGFVAEHKVNAALVNLAVVVSQNPSAGTQAPRGSTVELTVR